MDIIDKFFLCRINSNVIGISFLFVHSSVMMFFMVG